MLNEKIQELDIKLVGSNVPREKIDLINKIDTLGSALERLNNLKSGKDTARAIEVAQFNNNSQEKKSPNQAI